MEKAKLYLLGIGAFLVLVALAIFSFEKKKGAKPEAGSSDQMAQAREALKAKREAQKNEIENLEIVEDESKTFEPEGYV
jgi:hypothetical protein